MRMERRVAADAFFGTMTAGTTTAATIGAFLAASREAGFAEIGLHPALEAEAEMQSLATDGTIRSPRCVPRIGNDRSRPSWKNCLLSTRLRLLSVARN